MLKAYSFLSKMALLMGLITIVLISAMPSPSVAQDISSDTTPLTDQELENLIAFTKLYGYVRHFHPTNEVASANWHQIAVDGARAVEDAASPDELAAILEDVFAPVAPTVQVFPTDSESLALPDTLTNTDGMTHIIYWRHTGYGEGDMARQIPEVTFSIYHSDRESTRFDGDTIPQTVPDPRQPMLVELAGGVSAQVPLALFSDTAAPELDEPLYTLDTYNAQDRATRLAAVVIAWNIFQHFYPYFDVVDVDWEVVLVDSLTDIAQAPDGQSAQTVLQHMIATLEDGHAGVEYIGQALIRFAPYTVSIVEDQVLIVGVDASAEANLSVGDIILAADGQPIADILADARSLISSPTDQWFNASLMMWFATQDYTELTLQKADGSESSVSVEHTLFYENWFSIGTEPRPDEIFFEIEEGIWYIDLTRIEETGLFSSQIWDIHLAEGDIIFDVRGYPGNVSPFFLGHFYDLPMHTAQFLVPLITAPNRANVDYEDGSWSVPPLSHIDSSLVFLTDGRAISYAETFMAFVENYELGEIIGIPTAGTNGNVNRFVLPGGFQVRWTGMRVLKQDGSQHHGIGIQPTVPAQRTIEGVREGRDELLDVALDVIQSQ